MERQILVKSLHGYKFQENLGNAFLQADLQEFKLILFFVGVLIFVTLLGLLALH